MASVDEQDPSACVKTGTVEPEREPVSRAAAFCMLAGAAKVLEAANPVTGGVYVRGLVARMQDAIAREREHHGAPDPESKDEFRFHRMNTVQLFPHSEGVAILDKNGAVTVCDAALIAAAYHVLHSDRAPGQVLDAVEVRG
jgi:hypothetical protein